MKSVLVLERAIRMQAQIGQTFAQTRSVNNVAIREEENSTGIRAMISQRQREKEYNTVPSKEQLGMLNQQKQLQHGVRKTENQQTKKQSSGDCSTLSKKQKSQARSLKSVHFFNFIFRN